MIHIGQIIEQEMQKRGCTKVWLAKQLYCHRTNIGNILKRQSIDTEQLLKISKILQVNFFEYYTQEYESEK
ncbi:MAG: helix-turn-helix domain-containing protein [Bacteroidales bacterium]|nr:helix-turn-helix domain-containing protein [Bacteroidales bacterium]